MIYRWLSSTFSFCKSSFSSSDDLLLVFIYFFFPQTTEFNFLRFIASFYLLFSFFLKPFISPSDVLSFAFHPLVSCLKRLSLAFSD
jgi:hypothetical protein